MTAFALIFRDDENECFYLLCHQFVNSVKAHNKKLAAGVDYLNYEREGDITITPGNVTDYRIVKQYILDQCAKYDVQEIGYDPKFSTYIVAELTEEEITMQPMAQNITSMNGPTKEMEMEIMKGNVIHGGNKCLRWQFGCAPVPPVFPHSSSSTMVPSGRIFRSKPVPYGVVMLRIILALLPPLALSLVPPPLPPLPPLPPGHQFLGTGVSV